MRRGSESGRGLPQSKTLARRTKLLSVRGPIVRSLLEERADVVSLEMQLVRNIRAGRLKPLLQEQQRFYSQRRTPEEIRAWQLERFNEQWQGLRREIPYFIRITHERKLPERFASWDEFRRLMPVLDRKTIQSQRDEFRNPARAPDYFRTTGGSTAEPLQLPAWHSENEFSNRDVWLARSWFGISPADKLFLIWGHSHLLGRGITGRLNGIRRQLKDSLLGYCRWSAYDLSEAALRQAGDALLKFKPSYVIAYAVALDRFARANAARREAFRQLGLKVAIATAESFPRPDSATVIADVLGCPVTMEYGAVETGVVAHQKPTGEYNVFWQHYALTGELSPAVPGNFEIQVTSLYPRCFPLVRYRLGDLISESPDAPEFGQKFAAVIGRCNDFVNLADGSVIHSEAFAHAVKECPFVQSFQVVQRRDGVMEFNYVPAPQLEPDESEVRRRLAVIHPALRDVTLRAVESIPQTIAGKTRAIVREPAHE